VDAGRRGEEGDEGDLARSSAATTEGIGGAGLEPDGAASRFDRAALSRFPPRRLDAGERRSVKAGQRSVLEGVRGVRRDRNRHEFEPWFTVAESLRNSSSLREC
jgi:hypothetical protein